ncbi:MAG: transposase [Nitrososphaerales archaeon]|nr:transposase [Nitrososphaerales archaeon]
MCNDAIRIALKEKPRNRFVLIELAYARLKEYGLHTHYILSACEIAFAVYRNKDRKSDPCVRKAFLKLDSQTYSLNHLLLRIPTRPRHFISLTLKGSNYHLSFIDDPSLRRGSITLTGRTVSIAFSKEIAGIEPRGQIGIDVNERNITWSDTTGRTERIDTSDIAEVKVRYRAIRAKIAQKTQHDRRIRQRLLAKYGRREKNRTIQPIHSVSKKIVNHAKDNRFGIAMENLKGIRKLYRKGNGQGTSFRGRMNSWPFREAQRQIAYKAAWDGIPVDYIKPRGTSRKCPKCGSRVAPLQGRKLYCAECDIIWDRDELASKNIMAALVCAARPSKGSREGEPRTQEAASNPPSRRVEVGLRRHVPKT